MSAPGIGVVGAGTMGAGIAQVAAMYGHDVFLADASGAALPRARMAHERFVCREVEKGRFSRAAGDAMLQRIRYLPDMDPGTLQSFADCSIVIEAIAEQITVKQALLRALEDIVSSDAILATNTSSLSVTAIAGTCRLPHRVVGMHFFNPAFVMPLVEIVPALTTALVIVNESRGLVESWNKKTVLAADTPGFLVNRVARPFYGESLRLLEEGIADVASIDWAMRTLGEFRMGPFELMDLIGLDVNLAVTCSVYDGMFHDPRYRPSIRQQRLVEAGWLGRKTGRGFYDYREGSPRPVPTEDVIRGRTMVDRVVAMLVNEAVDFVHMDLGTVNDVELAMTAGLNYPRGLLEWGDQCGAATVLALLDELRHETTDMRYRASVALRRAAKHGLSLRDPALYSS